MRVLAVCLAIISERERSVIYML